MNQLQHFRVKILIMSEDEKDGDANSSDSTPAGETFEVEKILDVIRGRGNQPTRYKIRWAGYTAADDTWEEEKNLVSFSFVSYIYNSRLLLGLSGYFEKVLGRTC